MAGDLEVGNLIAYVGMDTTSVKDSMQDAIKHISRMEDKMGELSGEIRENVSKINTSMEGLQKGMTSAITKSENLRKRMGEQFKALKADVDSSVSGINSSLSKIGNTQGSLANRITANTRAINSMSKVMERYASTMTQFSGSMANTFRDSVALSGTRLNALEKHIDKVGVTAANAGKRTKGGMDNAGGGVRGFGRDVQYATGQSETFLGKLRIMSLNMYILAYNVKALGQAIGALIGPGFTYTAEMEQMQLGFSGILMSMTQIDGKNLEWNKAMEISAKLQKDIADDALLTTATTRELAQVYQSILAPAISAGWNLDQVRQFALIGSNAVKAIGLPAQQVVQELRDLIMGGIRPQSSTLAASIGVTDADVKKWKQTGELFDRLMERLEGFKRASKETQNSVMGLMSNIQDGIERILALNLSGFYTDIKNVLKEIQSYFYTIETINGKDIAIFNPQTSAFLKEINKLLQGVIENTRNFLSYMREFTPVFQTLYKHVGNVFNLIVAMFAVNHPFTAIIYLIGSILNQTGNLAPLLNTIAANIQKIVYAYLAWKAVSIPLVSDLIRLSSGVNVEIDKTGKGIDTATTSTGRLKGAMAALGATIKMALWATIIYTFISALDKLSMHLFEFRRRHAVGSTDATGKTIIGWKEEEKDVADNSWGKGNWDRKTRKVKVNTPVYKEDVEDAYENNPGMYYWRQVYEQYEANKVADYGNLKGKFETNSDADKKGAREARQAALAELDGQFKLAKEKIKNHIEDIKYMYQEGEISANEYFTQTAKDNKRIIELDMQEIREKMSVEEDQSNLVKLKWELQEKQLELDRKDVEIKREQIKYYKDLNKEVVKSNIELLKRQGKNVEATRAEGLVNFDENTRGARAGLADASVRLQQALLSPDSAERSVKIANALRDISVFQRAISNQAKNKNIDNALAGYDAELTKINFKLDEQTIKENDIKRRAENVTISQWQADADMLKVKKETYAYISDVAIPVLQEQIKAIEKEGRDVRQLTADLNGLKEKQKDLGAEIEKIKNPIGNLGAAIQNSLKDRFEEFANTAFDATKSVSQSFHDMVESILKDIARLLLKKALTDLLYSAFGLNSSKAAGGHINSSGAGLDGSARRNKYGGFIRRAEGGGFSGFIKGPGTSTSDDIPVLASNGEFMVRAAAVQKYGLRYMNMINRMQLPDIPHYSNGGDIGGGSSTTTVATAQPGNTVIHFHYNPSFTSNDPAQNRKMAAEDYPQMEAKLLDAMKNKPSFRNVIKSVVRA